MAAWAAGLYDIQQYPSSCAIGQRHTTKRYWLGTATLIPSRENTHECDNLKITKRIHKPWDLSIGSVRSILPFLSKLVAALPQLRAFSTQDQELPKTPLNPVRMFLILGERKHGPCLPRVMFVGKSGAAQRIIAQDRLLFKPLR